MSSVMTAVQYDHYGGSDVLELRRVPIPEPGPGELRLRGRASGVNPKDPLIRGGDFRWFSGRRFPLGTGFDFVATVDALGPGVDGPAPGTRVWGFLDGFRGGAAAEYFVAKADWLAPAPDGLGDAETAALPLVGLTALQALRDRAELQPGERLLIKGASGGVGSAAIQLGKALGAHVTAVASAASLEHCLALGADRAIDYRVTDPADLDARFDVILDCYGGSSYPRYARRLRRGGRLVSIAPEPGLLVWAALSRVLPIPRAATMFVRPRRADLETLAGYAARGELRMPVQATYPLERVREAHDAAALRHARGKRVLIVSDPDAVERRDAA